MTMSSLPPEFQELTGIEKERLIALKEQHAIPGTADEAERDAFSRVIPWQQTVSQLAARARQVLRPLGWRH